MATYKHRETGEQVQAKLFEHDRPWPADMRPWKDAGYQPRDMSFGFIQSAAGRVHICHGDYVVRRSGGGISVHHAKEFAIIYEKVTKVKR